MTCIRDAVAALDARKTALYGGASPKVEVDGLRGLMVGLDLSVDELGEMSDLVLSASLRGVLAGRTDVCAALRGTWVDGLLTGMLLCELRAREKAR